MDGNICGETMNDDLKKVAMPIARCIQRNTVSFLLSLYGRNHGLIREPYSNSFIQYRELLQSLFFQKIIRINSHIPWPVHFSSVVIYPQNIRFDKRYVRNFMSAGCYWQALSPLIFKGSFLVAQNVAFITQNHDSSDMSSHVDMGRPIVIGDNCLVSFNAVILPGVELGDNTVVGAGAVVNRSFPEGNCVIAGVPARVVKRLAPERIRKCSANDLWG